jgi:hypothetical protein
LTVFVLVLGVITIVAIQMAGAILYVTATLPPEALLKVFARYLRRGEEEAAVEFLPPFETMTRLIKMRRRVYHLIAVILLAGIAASIACAVYSPGALAFVIPGFLVASLNLLIAAGVLYIWIRQLRKMPEPQG